MGFFDFDHDGDFDLQDLIEADVKYGLFRDDEKELEELENKKVVKTRKKSQLQSQKNLGDIDERINIALENLDNIIYGNSYEENDLFDYYCNIADLYEEKFQNLKKKFLQEYQRICELSKQLPKETYYEDVDNDKLLSIYDDMEDCLCAFDDVLEYEYEYEFEDTVSEYLERKEQLEAELSKCEEIKEAVEYGCLDIKQIPVESIPQTTQKTVNEQQIKQEKYTAVQNVKQGEKIYSETKVEMNSIKTNKEFIHKEPIFKEKKTFAEMSIREKIAQIIVISIFAVFAIFIFANLPTIINFIVGAIVDIFKFIGALIQISIALIILFIFFFIMGGYKMFR